MGDVLRVMGLTAASTSGILTLRHRASPPAKKPRDEHREQKKVEHGLEREEIADLGKPPAIALRYVEREKFGVGARQGGEKEDGQEEGAVAGGICEEGENGAQAAVGC